MDCKACGASLARSARGRTPESCSGCSRKRGELVREAATQLSLEFETSGNITERDEQALDPESLTSFSRETLRNLGTHDQERRAWLRNWARSRSVAGDLADPHRISDK